MERQNEYTSHRQNDIKTYSSMTYFNWRQNNIKTYRHTEYTSYRQNDIKTDRMYITQTE